MIVADASAVIDGLLDPVGHAHVTRALVGLSGPVGAPDLVDVEVLSVLRRWERHGEIRASRARQVLDDLSALPIVRYSAAALTADAWALRRNFTAYDAQYVALARAVSAELLTTDSGMARAAKRLGVAIRE